MTDERDGAITFRRAFSKCCVVLAENNRSFPRRGVRPPFALARVQNVARPVVGLGLRLARRISLFTKM